MYEVLFFSFLQSKHSSIPRSTSSALGRFCTSLRTYMGLQQRLDHQTYHQMSVLQEGDELKGALSFFFFYSVE